MSDGELGPDDGASGSTPAGFDGGAFVPDKAIVMVVGRSRVNQVVVARIVERSGLRPLRESPESAVRTLGSMLPGTVILDGGSDNRDCEALLSTLGSLRRRSEVRAPAVILLSTAKIDEADRIRMEAVDAVVQKPILPEHLQPVIDRLVGREPE